MSSSAAAIPRREVSIADCITAFEHTFQNTEFLQPSDVCRHLEINYVHKLTKNEASELSVFASLGLHSTLILFPTPDPKGNPGVYYANLEYEWVDENVTRITSTDLVPQHAYYYLVMKIYQLFLHPAASERIFNHDIVEFISELNTSLAQGRAFFEKRVTNFFESNPEFLKHTDPEELQTSIAAVWDLLRSDNFKLAWNTVQKFFISTVGFDDPENYKLESQGTVTKDASAAFHKTVYGFHVLVYINGHAISMSLSRSKLFSGYSDTDKKPVFSFFNSDMIKYMASSDFMDLVCGIIEGPDSTLLSTKRPKVERPEVERHEVGRPEVGRPKVGEKQKLFAFECGCKSPIIGGYDRDGKLTLTYQTKRPDHREHIVGMDHEGKHYIFVNNYPSSGSFDTRLFVTCSLEFNELPNFCAYADIEAVNSMLGIKYTSISSQTSTSAEFGDSSSLSIEDSPQRNDDAETTEMVKQAVTTETVKQAVVNASLGAPTMQGERPRPRVNEAGAAVATPKPQEGLLKRACNFVRGLFFTPHTSHLTPHPSYRVVTPVCKYNYASIEFQKPVMFCVPESPGEGSFPRGGRRPVSRKYRNNISRKKKRISLRYRRLRRQSRRRSRRRSTSRSSSLCLKEKLK